MPSSWFKIVFGIRFVDCLDFITFIVFVCELTVRLLKNSLMFFCFDMQWISWWCCCLKNRQRYRRQLLLKGHSNCHFRFSANAHRYICTDYTSQIGSFQDKHSRVLPLKNHISRSILAKTEILESIW